MPFLPMSRYQKHAVLIGETGFEHPDLKNESVRLWVYLACVKFDNAAMDAEFKEDAQNCKNYLTNLSKEALAAQVKANNKVSVNIDGKNYDLMHGKHFFLNSKV
jgi:hypothetical protein